MDKLLARGRRVTSFARPPTVELPSGLATGTGASTWVLAVGDDALASGWSTARQAVVATEGAVGDSGRASREDAIGGLGPVADPDPPGRADQHPGGYHPASSANGDRSAASSNPPPSGIGGGRVQS